MKTRIKKTERIKNGIEEVVYQAQYFSWSHFTYKPIIGYYVEEFNNSDDTSSYVKCLWSEDLQPKHKRGTLEFCKELIDFVLLQEDIHKMQQKSRKVSYIKYP